MADTPVVLRTRLDVKQTAIIFRNTIDDMYNSWSYLKRKSTKLEWFKLNQPEPDAFAQFDDSKAEDFSAGFRLSSRSEHVQTAVQIYVFDEGATRRIVLRPVSPFGGSRATRKRYVEPLVDAYRMQDPGTTVLSE